MEQGTQIIHSSASTFPSYMYATLSGALYMCIHLLLFIQIFVFLIICHHGDPKRVLFELEWVGAAERTLGYVKSNKSYFCPSVLATAQST